MTQLPVVVQFRSGLGQQVAKPLFLVSGLREDAPKYMAGLCDGRLAGSVKLIADLSIISYSYPNRMFLIRKFNKVDYIPIIRS